MQAGTANNNNGGEDEDLDIDAFFLPGGILDPEANNAAAQEHTVVPPSSAEGPTGGVYEKAPSSYGSADLATILPIFASKSSPVPSNPWNDSE